MQLKVFLEQPFDYFNNNKNKWLYIITSAIFALLFLLMFQPYGISEEMTNPVNTFLHKALFFVSIAFSTLLALSLSQFVLRQSFGYQNVNNKKYILWLFFEALVLLLINFGMSFIVPDLGNDFEKELNIWFQIKMYPRVLMVLLFPFFGTIIYIAIQRLNTELQDLSQQLKTYKYRYEESHQQEVLNILDENNQLDITLNFNDFLYAESSNQYVLIHYLKNKQLKKHIVRNRLKHILAQTTNVPIKQCHRSFAINLIHVDHLIKKKGKEFLAIFHNEETIHVPISNSYLETIKQELKG